MQPPWACRLALRLGRRTVQDVSVFFLAENDRLFVLDARRLSHYGHGLTGYIDGTLQTQELLRRLTEMCDVPAGADEILSVERIRENKSHYIFLCRTRCSGRGTDRRTCFLVKGDPDEEELLLQMERRRNLNSIPESAADRSLSAVLISFLTLAGFIILCVLSHPAVDRLPSSFSISRA